MWRSMLTLPLVVITVGGVGFGICKAVHWNANTPELFLAGAVSIAAGLAACAPLLLTRSAPTESVAQAGLAGTVIQMLLNVGLLALSWMAGIRPHPIALVWWMMAFYWATLSTLVVVIVGAIRATERRAHGERASQLR